MRLGYDFHLHTCLSPCGGEDMTPYNIVNMAKLLGLDIIAVADHNTTGNCASAIAAGKEVGVAVIAGMELCTAEEVHLVCLFPELESAEMFGSEVGRCLPQIKNNPDIFGDQLYVNARDEVSGSEEILLVTASSLALGQAKALVERFGGFCYPAHIDRSSYSIISSLGGFPSEYGFTCAEVSSGGSVPALKAAHPALDCIRIMRSSDAHRLEDMREAADILELPECSAKAAVSYLASLTSRH